MRFLKRMDYYLLIGLALFIAFGVMMVYSASYSYAYIHFENSAFYFQRQLFWAGIGCLFLIITMILPYKVYGKLTPILIILTVGMLLLVLVPDIGVERNFSKRWISIGGILFQPVELAKVTLLIYFAYFYSRKEKYLHSFKNGVAPPLIILAIVFALILKQPDLGSSILIVFSCGMILFFAKVRFRHLFLLMMAAVLVFFYFAITSSYRLERITSFLAPFDDMNGSGYQLINSYISISTGGLTGVGLGNSVQKLGYLPEAHTDFIMAIIAEELGFKGVLAVTGFYFFFFVRGLLISRRAADSFGKLLAIGITFQIITQAFINLGAVLGFLPITGITLPFVSYGGSSLFIMMISAGILLNISFFQKDVGTGSSSA